MNDDSLELLKKDFKNLQKLIEITKIINATLDIGKLLTAVMEAIKNILHTEASSLLFYDELTDELVFKAVVGEASDQLTEKYRFKTSVGIAGWCAHNRTSLIVNDVYSDNRFNPDFDRMTGFRTTAIICAPLLFKGKLIGVVEGINPVGCPEFTDEDMKLFDLFAEQAVMAVQNAIVFERSIESKKMQFEINSAKELFKNFYQPRTIKRESLSATMVSRPCGQFSGDIYTNREEDDHIAIMMADSGLRSLPGAITASYIAGKITAFGRVCPTTSEVIRHFAQGQKDIPVPRNSSLFYGKLFPETNQFEYTLHGSIKFLLFTSNGIKLIKANSEINEDRINRSRITLNNGDSILIFTEGITELKNKMGHPYGIKNLAKCVAPALSTESILSDILERTSKHGENFLTFLDQTMICIKNG